MKTTVYYLKLAAIVYCLFMSVVVSIGLFIREWHFISLFFLCVGLIFAYLLVLNYKESREYVRQLNQAKMDWEAHYE